MIRVLETAIIIPIIMALLNNEGDEGAAVFRVIKAESYSIH